MSAYRNRPDRRRAQFLQVLGTTPLLDIEFNSIDGTHLQVTFDQPVTWDGNPEVFIIYNNDDAAFVVPNDGTLSADRKTLILNFGGTIIGVLTITPAQSRNHVVGDSGAILGPDGITFTV